MTSSGSKFNSCFDPNRTSEENSNKYFKTLDYVYEKNASNISEQISQLSLGHGEFSQGGVWKVKQKICPRSTDPPMAKRDSYGKSQVTVLRNIST